MKTDISKLNIPKNFKILFERIKSEHYEELYEKESDGTVLLADDIEEILISLSDNHKNNKNFTHLCYLWMTLILTLVAQPTLRYYQPRNLLPQKIINVLIYKIIEIIDNNSISQSYNIPEFNPKKFINHTLKQQFYIEKEIVNFQILDEALDVFYNAIRVVNYDQAVEAILNILEDCLEGYAIFPGSHGRRELFDWWLLDVVPSSYNLLPPKIFYVVEGVQNREEIKSHQTLLLKTVSDQMSNFIT
ncbi:MAG: hypothetical protein F6K62_18430, partial [Sphaerospermopsis sp. SIO1G2]|nr:hypothetical protein [Sphaerospermopsis sp. SIO1G2]